MIKCNDCKHYFDAPAQWKESRGEFWGQPAFETMTGCPYCYSTDYEEITTKEEENDDS